MSTCSTIDGCSKSTLYLSSLAASVKNYLKIYGVIKTTTSAKSHCTLHSNRLKIVS